MAKLKRSGIDQKLTSRRMTKCKLRAMAKPTEGQCGHDKVMRRHGVRFFSMRAITSWHKIPDNIKMTSTVWQFKKKLC